jgi:hypothetical protein
MDAFGESVFGKFVLVEELILSCVLVVVVEGGRRRRMI